MTDTPDFEGLRGLLERATLRPWRLRAPFMSGSFWDIVGPLDEVGEIRQPIGRVPTTSAHSEKDTLRGGTRHWNEPIKNAEANAALIVAAVNLAPTLLAEVARLTAELERARPLLEAVRKYAAGPVGNLAWRDVLDHARAYAQAKETP